MSCNIPIPSIEAHITPPHMSPSIKARNQEDHLECLHHFFEQPYVLPESLPDDLVAFPIPKDPHPPAFLEPPILAQLKEPPKAERHQQDRELLGSIPLNATPKRHDTVQPPTVAAHKLSNTLLVEIRHKDILRHIYGVHTRNMPMPSPFQQ
jgi:hypothetical protein